jgi:hypothetical protein
MFRDIEKLRKSAPLRKRNVRNGSTAIANKMGVLLKIGAITRGLPLDIDLLGQSALNKCLQAIIDCRQRNSGNSFFCSDENFRRSGMIPLLEKHIINFTTLRSEAMAAMADRLFVSNRLKFPLRHESGKINRRAPQSRIILIKNC